MLICDTKEEAMLKQLNLVLQVTFLLEYKQYNTVTIIATFLVNCWPALVHPDTGEFLLHNTNAVFITEDI